MEYMALYTHQKTKKSKTWHDGVLKVLVQERKATLYDDTKKQIDSVSLKSNQVIEEGCDLESARYLIQVERLLCQNCATTTAATEVISVLSSPAESKCEALTQAIGIRKNHMAFNSPRSITPQHEIDNSMYFQQESMLQSRHDPYFVQLCSSEQLSPDILGTEPATFAGADNVPGSTCQVMTFYEESQTRVNGYVSPASEVNRKRSASQILNLISSKKQSADDS